MSHRSLRRIGTVGVVAAAALAPAHEASYAGPRGSSGAVPKRVQRAIRKQVSPLYAYVPRRLPRGWRLTSWDPGASTNHPPTGIRLNLWFEKPGDSLAFQVSPSPPADYCRKPGRGAWGGTYRVNGVRIYWAANRELETWRCIRRGRRTVQLGIRAWGRHWAADRVTPVARRHARTLARILAGAHRLR